MNRVVGGNLFMTVVLLFSTHALSAEASDVETYMSPRTITSGNLKDNYITVSKISVEQIHFNLIQVMVKDEETIILIHFINNGLITTRHTRIWGHELVKRMDLDQLFPVQLQLDFTRREWMLNE